LRGGFSVSMRLGLLVQWRAGRGWKAPASRWSFLRRRERGAAKVAGTYGNEVIDESAGRAVVAEDVAGAKAADIKITIRTKDQVARKVEAVIAGGYKRAQKGAGGAVVVQHLVGVEAGDEETAIGAKGDATRTD